MLCIKGCRSGQGVRENLLDIGKYEHTKMMCAFRPAAATQSSRLKNYKTETPCKQWRRAIQNFLEAMLGAVRDRYCIPRGSLLQAGLFPASPFSTKFFFFFFLENSLLFLSDPSNIYLRWYQGAKKNINHVILHASNYNII